LLSSSCLPPTAPDSTSSPAANLSASWPPRLKLVDRVVFSGVGKTTAEIDLALKAGILQFNVESEAELALLAARASKLKTKARFALRVNPDVFADTHPYISTGLREHKFGIDIRQAARIYKSVAKHRWLVPYGISVHIGSQIRSADPFGAAMQRVSKLSCGAPA
jgi:diaminopimelate decarboxylase